MLTEIYILFIIDLNIPVYTNKSANHQTPMDEVALLLYIYIYIYIIYILSYLARTEMLALIVVEPWKTSSKSRHK